MPTPSPDRPAACGQEFRAFDGPQKCGRVKGHPGAHTRDPLPSDRRAFDAATVDRYRDSTWLTTSIGERIAHHLQVTALLREQGMTKEAAELDERFHERLAWEFSA